MNFIHEQDGALAETPPVARLFENFAQILDAGENRGKLLEVDARAFRHQPRDGGLAGARRPPENHGSGLLALGDAAQRSALAAQEMVLADDLVER